MLHKMKRFTANQQHRKMVQELCKSCRFDISPNLKSNAKLYINTLWIQPKYFFNPQKTIAMIYLYSADIFFASLKNLFS